MSDKEAVVALEVCEAEFERWTEAMDLSFDPKGWDDEDKKTFIDAKNRLLKAMESGALVVDVEGRLVYTPLVGKDRTPIVWNEPSGADLMAMDQKKNGHNVAKTYAVMGSMTGVQPTRFTGMKARDLKVCQAIYALFLAS